MKQHFNRLIEDFEGMAAIIGCSAWHSFCDNKYSHDPEEYYSIDINKGQSPDFVMDITGHLPAELENRFKIVYVEHVDCFAYNDDFDGINDDICISKKGSQGFNNLLKMTAPDGVIVIEGCPREIEFRQQIYYRRLKYIELNNSCESILIPKNQYLSCESILLRLEQLSKPLCALIDRLRDDNPTFKYCDLPIKSCGSFRQFGGAINADSKIKELIYKELYPGLYEENEEVSENTLEKSTFSP